MGSREMLRRDDVSEKGSFFRPDHLGLDPDSAIC